MTQAPENRGGRPRVGDQVKMAFQPDLLARIDTTAEREGISRSEWVRRACERVVETREEPGMTKTAPTQALIKSDHVDTVTVSVETASGNLHKLTIRRPGPSGDNPRFIQQQIDSALDEIRVRLDATIKATYGDQASR